SPRRIGQRLGWVRQQHRRVFDRHQALAADARRMVVEQPHLSDADAALLDAFCDQLWLEDGLAKNTLEAYRRDLRLFGQWLARGRRSLLEASESDLLGYLAARHAEANRPRASTQARALSSFKRFYHYAVRER